MQLTDRTRRFQMAFSLLLSFALFSGCTTLSSGLSVSPSVGSYSIMQGPTGSSWTRINLLRDKSEKLDVVFSQEDTGTLDARLIHNTTREFAASNAVIEEYAVQGLDPQKTYQMKVYRGGKLVDERSFSALIKKEKLNFAVISCADDQYLTEQKKMWGFLASENPDFILSIGDHPYADRYQGKPVVNAEPFMLWDRYVDARKNLELYRFARLIPVIATWDDHDYGSNGGGRDYKYRNESKQIFLSFFPQSYSWDNFMTGPGVASRVTFGEQKFVLLDNRSFRSEGGQSPICHKKKDSPFCKPHAVTDLRKKEVETHFGVQQNDWALTEVKSAGSDVVWMISGDQWFGAYSPFESFEGGYPKDFKKFMGALASLPNSRVAFVSGDRHSSEISVIEPSLLGYQTIEVVSSPIHARVFGNNWIDFPNPRQAASLYGAFNFAMITSSVADQNWNIHVRVIKQSEGNSGELAFERFYKILRPIAD